MRVLVFVFLLFSAVVSAEESGHKLINGVKLYYKTIGQGEPVVVLHGGPGLFHDYLLPHMGNLAKDFQLIFYDQRGNGGSALKPEQYDFNMDTMVEDLEGIRKAFKLDKMNLVGHSFGGLIAMTYAIKYPDKLKTMVLVTSSPPDGYFNKEIGANKNRNGFFATKFLEYYNATTSKPNQSKLEEFIAGMKFGEQLSLYDPSKADTMTGAVLFDQARLDNLMLMQKVKLVEECYDLLPKLADLKVRTLVIAGAVDTMPISSYMAIMQTMKNAWFVLFNKSGHAPYAEQPDKFHKVLKEFINK
ncbi:MAG: alpha/beta fold hydrolase [Algicola sp.]|nr:alpha/beta fold hydrolase [Algicola sp.]